MSFKYKFSTAVKILFAVIYALAVVCLVWNIIRLINSISSGISLELYGYISVVLCLVLPVVVSVFITAMIISSSYTLANGTLTVSFGLLKDKYAISDIESLVRNVKTDVLVMNFKDESFLKIVIEPKLFDDFSASVLKLNKSVQYGETDEDNRKKGKNA